MDLAQSSRGFTLPLQTEQRTPVPMASQPDHDRLEQLYEDMGRDRAFVLDLVEMYRARVDAFAAAARSEGAGQSLADQAHQLAGASGPLGLTAVSDAAARAGGTTPGRATARRPPGSDPGGPATTADRPPRVGPAVACGPSVQLEPIAHTANRGDLDARQFGSDRHHVGVDRAARAQALLMPHLVEEAFPLQCDAGMGREVRQ